MMEGPDYMLKYNNVRLRRKDFVSTANNAELNFPRKTKNK